MLHVSSRRASGFTLVEMTIVLGIAGILFGGLWKMLSVGNAQMRDQAAANQQLQLVAAVSNYLQSQEGQTYLTSMVSPKVFTLPSGAGCVGADPAGLCNYLPAGFYSSTENPYGQRYSIGVRKDANTYSFMVLTSGTKRIPDASGGRISAAMGGDGGFVYNSNVCSAAFNANACGAYGAWIAGLADYGLPVPANGGYVASRSYPSASLGSGDVWLARNALAGDANRIYNTMTTDLYLGGRDVYFNKFDNTAPGGKIYLGTSAQIIGLQGTGGLGNGGATLTLAGNMGTVAGTKANPVLQVSSGCIKASLDAADPCNYVASILGSLTIRDFGYAAQGFFSGQFIYQSSDARLKSNIQPLSNAIEGIMKLKPVSFDYKSNGKKAMGFIAQEVEKVYPQLVTEGPEGMKGMTYEGLVAPLVQSVQDLKKENDALRSQLKEQDARQTKMEAEIAKLRPSK